MNDGTNVDWGPLKPPDYAGDYASAFAAGRRMAALTPQPGSPISGSGTPPPPPDPAAQRMASAQKAEIMAKMLHGLQMASPDPRQRLVMAQHLAMASPSLGINPQDINLADMTETGIVHHLAGLMALQQQLLAPSQGMTPNPSPQAASSGSAGPSPTPFAPNQGAVRYLGPVD